MNYTCCRYKYKRNVQCSANEVGNVLESAVWEVSQTFAANVGKVMHISCKATIQDVHV